MGSHRLGPGAYLEIVGPINPGHDVQLRWRSATVARMCAVRRFARGKSTAVNSTPDSIRLECDLHLIFPLSRWPGRPRQSKARRGASPRPQGVTTKRQILPSYVSARSISIAWAGRINYASAPLTGPRDERPHRKAARSGRPRRRSTLQTPARARVWIDGRHFGAGIGTADR